MRAAIGQGRAPAPLVALPPVRAFECIQASFHFATESPLEVVARFDGGAITTGAGGPLPHKTEQDTAMPRQFAGCFRHPLDPARIKHTKKSANPRMEGESHSSSRFGERSGLGRTRARSNSLILF